MHPLAWTCQEAWPKSPTAHECTANLAPGCLPLVTPSQPSGSLAPDLHPPHILATISSLWASLTCSILPPAHSPAKPCPHWCLPWHPLSIFQPGLAGKHQAAVQLWPAEPPYLSLQPSLLGPSPSRQGSFGHCAHGHPGSVFQPLLRHVLGGGLPLGFSDRDNNIVNSPHGSQNFTTNGAALLTSFHLVFRTARGDRQPMRRQIRSREVKSLTDAYADAEYQSCGRARLHPQAFGLQYSFPDKVIGSNVRKFRVEYQF